MKNRITRVFAIVLIAAFSNSLDARADVSAGGKATIDKVSNLFSVWNGTPNQGMFREAAQLIDYDEMSERALGAHWNKLNPTERREFVQTLQHIIEDKYYKRWHKVFVKSDVSYKAESPVDGDLLVRTDLKTAKKQDQLVWRLSKRGGSYKVISISVNKKDLLDRLTTRLDQRLRKKDDFKQLLAWMRDEGDVEDTQLPRKS